MWTIAVIFASSVQNVGQFSSQADCDRALAQFQKPGVVAGCVQQPTAEQSMAQAQHMMNQFMNSVNTK
jgi:hypothetical protein